MPVLSTSEPAGRLLVVAHPDDEILWFSSILARVDAVVVCFLDYGEAEDLGRGRREVLARHPVAGLRCLGIREAGSLDRADWSAPAVERWGLRLGDRETQRRYRRNGAALRRRLPALVAGFAEIFTHNPWGEYGHEDHVQVHAVLREITAASGADLWVPACCSEKALALARRYRLAPGAPRLERETDRPLARRVEALYRRHRCWTWKDGWDWPPEETFLRTADLTFQQEPAADLSHLRLLGG
jgi:LmbE family N-acetylglucosaminyl deacetylase